MTQVSLVRLNARIHSQREELSHKDFVLKQRAEQIASLQDRVARLESDLRLRIWNDCKRRGIPDDHAYQVIARAFAALQTKTTEEMSGGGA